MGCEFRGAPAPGGPCPSPIVTRAWIDGELDAERACAVARHVERCGACSALVAEERSMERALRAVRPSPMRIDAAALANAASRRREEEIRLVRMLRRVAAVAAVLVFASTLIGAWSHWSVPRRAAAASIGEVTASETTLHLIDDDNSFLIAVRRR